jgi:ABC-type nitrate/sulfonate/bicarbonate transport system ATPase subunit
VLSGVNAEVRDIIVPGKVKGQVVGILGPSGCGKTTLFRIIAGLHPPTSGLVSVNGFDRPVMAGEVGVVAQSYPLFEHRTVLGNLMLGATKEEKDAKVAHDKVMAFLTEFGWKTSTTFIPAQLSGGQRQRCAIIQQIYAASTFCSWTSRFPGST